MLVCRHPIGPTINLWVKTFFDAHSRKTKPFQLHIYDPSYAYLVEQSKLLVLSSTSLFICSCRFDSSYTLSSMEVSLDSAKLAIRNKNGENTFSPHT